MNAAAGSFARNSAPLGTAWRKSYDIDDPRAQVGAIFWEKSESVGPMLKFHDVYRQTVNAYAREFRDKGRTLPISYNAAAILKAIFQQQDKLTGQADPSLDTIATRCGLSRRTVVRQLHRLREAKIIDWVRRTVRVDDGGETKRGYQCRQTSNAYFIHLDKLPAEILRTLRNRLGDKLREVRGQLRGSGAVPGRLAGMAAKLAKGFAAGLGANANGAARSLRTLASQGDDARLAHMYGGDLDAIAAHKEMEALSFGVNASATVSLKPAPRIKEQKE